jgi:NitT/TauT family transport system substrate-binding protein
VRRVPTTAFAAVLAVVAVVAAGCGKSSHASASDPVTVHLGYFPNITHATAIVGVEKGIYAGALGRDRLQTATFNAGPDAVSALFSGSIDASYLGPNPAVNAYAKSHGAAIRIISGATSGGAELVVRPEIADAQGLRGKKLATPQLGGTQDVALRYWLRGQGLRADTQGGGDVSILPQDNGQTLDAFKSGQIDGAWVPEPWATRLVQEGGGKVLVDERDLWPNRQFATTVLAVRTDFLRAHPDAVKRLLQGQAEANDYVNEHAEDAQAVVNEGIQKITGKKLAASVVAGAWPNMTFTDDPVATTVRASADHAHTVGLQDPVSLAGIFDLAPLNQVLRAAHESEVHA